MNKRAFYLMLSGVVVAVDQATKFAVDRLLALHESREILPGLVNLTYVRNRGAAFGVLSDADLPFQPALLTLVSVCALAAIAFYATRLPAGSRLPQTGLSLIMGGAVGNLLNRAFLGYVIDFVDVYWGRHHWPAFNVADSCISVGVGLLILDVLLAEKPAEPAAVGGAQPLARGD
jgi:signal peptidase II